MRLEPSAPKSLADPAALLVRRALAAQAPHLAPLRPLVDRLRAEKGETPEPDPLDGGAEARFLLLLETPGPRIRRTGFVSRDNPAETAANLFRALAKAGIARADTLIWNAVPWVIHDPGALNRAPRRAEVAAGLGSLPPLLDALPRLTVAVLAGRVAAEAEPAIRAARPALPILRMPHPSPTYLCTSPAHPARVAAALAEAAALLRQDPPPQGGGGGPREARWRGLSSQAEPEGLTPGGAPPPPSCGRSPSPVAARRGRNPEA